MVFDAFEAKAKFLVIHHHRSSVLRGFNRPLTLQANRHPIAIEPASPGERPQGFLNRHTYPLHMAVEYFSIIETRSIIWGDAA